MFSPEQQADLAKFPVEFWKLLQGGPKPCRNLTLTDGKGRN